MLELIELRAKNIFKYKYLKIDFTIDDKFIFIRGRNGVGKSLLGDILTDVLFDRAIRKHPADSFVSGGKSGFSSLALRDSLSGEEFLIRKYRNHSKYGDKVFFYREPTTGKRKNLSRKRKRDTYKIIWKVLGINWETFKNRNFFGQRDTKRFLDVTDSKKAEIIIDIQDLKDLQKCKEKSHQSFKEKQKEEETTLSKISDLSISSKVIKEGLEELRKTMKEIKARKEQEIQKTKDSITGVKKKISYAEKQTSGVDQLRYELSILKVQIEQADEILSQLEEASNDLNKTKLFLQSIREDSVRSSSDIKLKGKEVIKIKDGKVEKCERCGAKLNTTREKHLLKKLISEIKLLRKKVESLTIKIESLKKKSTRVRSKVRILNDRKNELTPMIKKRENLLRDLRLKEKWESEMKAFKREVELKRESLKELRKEINNMVAYSSIPETKAKVDKVRTEIKDKSKDLSLIKKEKGKYEFAENVFENSIRQIFDGFLDQLTKWTNAFAQEIFEEKVGVVFSPKRETKSKNIVDELNVKVSIDGEISRDARLLSGGERGRIDIATQLGLFSSADSPIQLLWMDEPLEGIDKSGILLVLELLKNKADEGVKIIMVTHRAIPTGMGTSLRVSKSKGIRSVD